MIGTISKSDNSNADQHFVVKLKNSQNIHLYFLFKKIRLLDIKYYLNVLSLSNLNIFNIINKYTFLYNFAFFKTKFNTLPLKYGLIIQKQNIINLII